MSQSGSPRVSKGFSSGPQRQGVAGPSLTVGLLLGQSDQGVAGPSLTVGLLLDWAHFILSRQAIESVIKDRAIRLLNS
jgi:hypothetical protein